MPPKKLFLSSTCYDLNNVRARIDAWARKNEFEPMLSDRASFPIDPSQHRHDICLANAKSADLFVLVVAGRYGAPYYADPTISVTWRVRGHRGDRCARRPGRPRRICERRWGSGRVH